MNNRISTIINPNGVISYPVNPPKLYQGTASWYYLDVEVSEGYGNLNFDTDRYVCLVTFRRADGKNTPFLPMSTEDNKVWTLHLNSDWYFYTAGNLNYTLKLVKIVKQKQSDGSMKDVEYILGTSYNSLYINPTPDFDLPAPVTPSAYDVINTRLTEIDFDINKFEEANPITNIETGDPIDSDKITIKVTHLDESVEDISINLPEGLTTDEEVDTRIDNKFDSVNPVIEVLDSNEDMKVSVMNYKGETQDINIKLPEDVVKENEISTAVFYNTLEGIDEPIINIVSAQLDGDGRNIVDTYVTNVIEPKSNQNYFDKTNSFYVIENTEVPSLYYTEDIISGEISFEQTENTLKINDEFAGLFINEDILNHTFDANLNYTSGLGVFKFVDGSNTSVLTQLRFATDANGKIKTLALGWNVSLIFNGVINLNSCKISELNNAGGATKMMLTSTTSNETLLNEIINYLYIGELVDNRTKSTKYYRLLTSDETVELIDKSTSETYTELDNKITSTNNKISNLLSIYTQTLDTPITVNSNSYLIYDLNTPDTINKSSIFRVESVDVNYVLINIINTNSLIIYNPTESNITINALNYYYLNI